MKYIKTFESLDGPQVGDYVVCEEGIGINELCDFINNTVGKIIKIDKSVLFTYIVKYENIPQDFKIYFNIFGSLDNSRGYSTNELLFWSKNKKDVEEYLMSKKYNL